MPSIYSSMQLHVLTRIGVEISIGSFVETQVTNSYSSFYCTNFCESVQIEFIILIPAFM